MFVQQIISCAIDEAKDLIRKRIEYTAEGTFEDERRKAYAEGALSFGENIELMTLDDREKLRLKCQRDLKEKRNDIVSLWEKMIERTAYFQIEFEIVARLVFFVALICFLFSIYTAAIVFGIVTIILFIISIIPGLFQTVMFILTGLGFISDRLLVRYTEYGRIEAALYFADYRRLTRVREQQQTWIFTTSHKNPPPE